MKRIKQISFFVFFLSFIACKNDKYKEGNPSLGNINEISIVISDVLWNGEVGDSIRKKFAAPVDGLTQEEPLFTLNQYHQKSFNGNYKRGRNIIVIDKDSPAEFTSRTDSYCSPQNIFTLKGKNIDELLSMIEMHSDEIIKTVKQTEITEYQIRNKKGGLLNGQTFANKFGIVMNIPSTYNYAMQSKDFVWLKRDIASGNTNLLIYRVPYTVIEKDKNIINNIIKMRDSIGTVYIHGQESDTYMITEEAYSPYIFMTSFNDKRAFETRGNWEMKNDFMSGPFLNYAVRDDKNQCYLIIEGFIYSPSSPKRDLIIELESIIKSTTFI